MKRYFFCLTFCLLSCSNSYTMVRLRAATFYAAAQRSSVMGARNFSLERHAQGIENKCKSIENLLVQKSSVPQREVEALKILLEDKGYYKGIESLDTKAIAPLAPAVVLGVGGSLVGSAPLALLGLFSFLPLFPCCCCYYTSKADEYRKKGKVGNELLKKLMFNPNLIERSTRAGTTSYKKCENKQ